MLDCEARRTLENMEKAEDRNQFLLKPYVVACEAAGLLSVRSGTDAVRAMSPHVRNGHLAAVLDVLEPSALLPVPLLATICVSRVETLIAELAALESSSDAMNAKIEQIMVALMPTAAASKVHNFDYDNPSFSNMLSFVVTKLESESTGDQAVPKASKEDVESIEISDMEDLDGFEIKKEKTQDEAAVSKLDGELGEAVQAGRATVSSGEKSKPSTK